MSPQAFAKRHPLILIATVALLLRLPFLDGSIDFFDAPQYVNRSEVASLWQTLSLGHAPYHPGYVALTWLAHHLLPWLATSVAVALVSVLASTGSLVLVFLIARRLQDYLFDARVTTHESRARTPYACLPARQVVRRTSLFPWLVTALVAVTPYFWISSITILVDPVMIAFYLLSVWLYLEWLVRAGSPLSLATLRPSGSGVASSEFRLSKPALPKPKAKAGVPGGPLTTYYLLLGSGLAFGAALFTHTQIALWVLGFPALIVATTPAKDWLRMVWRSLPWLVGPLLAIAGYVSLLLAAGHDDSVTSAVRYLVLGNAGDRGPWEIVSGARNFRLVGGTVLALAAVIGSVQLIVQGLRATPKPEGRRVGVGLALWLWPGLVVSGLFIYSNLSGRSSILAVVPAALLAASLASGYTAADSFADRRRFNQRRSAKRSAAVSPWLTVVLLASTLATSAPLIGAYATQPSLLEDLSRLRQKLDQDGLFISSNEAKTMADYPAFDVVYELPEDRIVADIERTLAAGGPVYVGTDAITYPFHAIDGTNWRTFSPAGQDQYRQHGSLAAYLFNRYEIELDRVLPDYPHGIAQVLVPGDVDVGLRHYRALTSVLPGERVVVGRILDGPSGEPVSHLQVNAYGQPAVHPQRIDRFDWPTQLGLALERSRGRRTRDPLSWSYSDIKGYFSFGLPPASSVDEFALVTHTLASGKTMSAPPLFVVPDVKLVAAGSETMVAPASRIAQRLNELGSAIAVAERLDDTAYRATITAFGYNLPGSDTIEAAELSGHVSTILPDGSREVLPGQKGNVTFGPWKDLPPGNYVATWRLRRTTEGEDRVLRLDVGYNFGEGTIFEQSVGAGDLPLGELREISVPFTVEPPMKLLEFRTLALAGPGFVVDSITVRPK